MAYYAEFAHVRKLKNGLEVRVDYFAEEGVIEFSRDYQLSGEETRPMVINQIRAELKRLNAIAPLEVLIKDAIDQKTRILE